VRAARETGVEVRPIDVAVCEWESTLEADDRGRPAIRLGLRLVKGMSEAGAKRLIGARARGAFRSVADLAARSCLDQGDIGTLAAAGALRSLASNRYRARWDAAGIEKPVPLFESTAVAEAIPMLKSPTEGESIVADYASLGLTLERHPLALLRSRLDRLRVLKAESVRAHSHGRLVHAAGLVITRQRPASAAGVTFVTLEDETGYLNLIVWEKTAERDREALLGASLLGVKGMVQTDGDVLHIIARRLFDYSELLGRLRTRSRDFH
jgi:error-prone DNA polymerase